jgi:hypothetical protein
MISDKDKIDLVSFYTVQHYGLKKLAKLFGVTPRAIKKRLQKQGVYRGKMDTGIPGQRSVPQDLTLDLLDTLRRGSDGNMRDIHRMSEGIEVSLAGYQDLPFELPSSLVGRTVQFIVRVRCLSSGAALITLRLQDNFDHSDGEPQWIGPTTSQFQIERTLDHNAKAFVRNRAPRTVRLLIEEARLEMLP